VFANKDSNLNPKTIVPTLRFLWNEFLFEVQNVATGEEVRIDEKLFEAPEDYAIQFLSFDGKENELSGEHAGTIDDSDIDELAAHYCWAGVKARNVLRIIGERDDAMLLAERIRAFTHHFALNLVAGNDRVVDRAFSAKVSDKQSAAWMRTEIARLEVEYGKFEHFDHVKVIAVYNGEHRDTKVSEEMPLARGIDRSARRGQSSFNLISVHTPNAIAVHEYTVELYIIEEDDVFRISGLQIYSGY
jgi:hypothetical protein